MKLYLPVLILSFIFISCSSSVRFSKDESSSENKKEEVAEVYETEDAVVLESTTGTASYYADKFHGRKTASGEIYNMYDLTAAHSNYPFGTIIRVINLNNDKSVILKINDRQPGYKGRIIDLSLKAAEELDMINSGIAEVKIEVLKWGIKN